MLIGGGLGAQLARKMYTRDMSAKIKCLCISFGIFCLVVAVVGGALLGIWLFGGVIIGIWFEFASWETFKDLGMIKTILAPSTPIAVRLLEMLSLAMKAAPGPSEVGGGRVVGGADTATMSARAGFNEQQTQACAFCCFQVSADNNFRNTSPAVSASGEIGYHDNSVVVPLNAELDMSENTGMYVLFNRGPQGNVGIKYEQCVGDEKSGVFVRILELIPDGPAFNCGKLVCGDIIESVDDKSLASLSSGDISDCFTGQPGSIIALYIRSRGALSEAERAKDSESNACVDAAMFCPSCGVALAAGVKFCTNCGTNVIRVTVGGASDALPAHSAQPPYGAAETLRDRERESADEMDDDLKQHLTQHHISLQACFLFSYVCGLRSNWT